MSDDEPKNVRLARMVRQRDDAAKRIAIELARGNFAGVRSMAEQAAYADEQVKAIEAEPARTNVVGRPTVRG